MDRTEAFGRVSIASPCKADWRTMEGNERARFCGSCRKFVYDFSALTTVEIAELIRVKEGRVCARIYRRRDGTMLTADCPIGKVARRRRNVVAVALAGLGLVLANFASAFRPVGGYCATNWSGRLSTFFSREPETVSATMGLVAPDWVAEPDQRKEESAS